ncbi:hypothetical protein [Streptomyces torulosus]|uniref:hypothetical protein n=1 Tax=Streptomyces torulosus TaxID=68276 RepID=UPI001F0A1FC0|nr:hypothetical protein [Streptomyces torulosus]
MTEAPMDAADIDGDDDADRKVVEQERAELKQFIKGLSTDDIKSGNWFAKLLAHAMSSYTEKVDWQYFQERYEGVPADAIVDQRIKMASRYAALEGGLSAGAYTATVVATLGSAGGASPATVPAAVTTMMVDVAFITRLQLRLAYDVAVLYRVPLDLSDPEDMWKLIRVAFTIKSGETVQKGVTKAVPAIMNAAADQEVLLRRGARRRENAPGRREAPPAEERHQDRHPPGRRSPRSGTEPLHHAARRPPRASRLPERGAGDRARRGHEQAESAPAVAAVGRVVCHQGGQEDHR